VVMHADHGAIYWRLPNSTSLAQDTSPFELGEIIPQVVRTRKSLLPREIVAVLRLSKAIYSRSAAFGEFINPPFHRYFAPRSALRPAKRSGASFCFDFPRANNVKRPNGLLDRVLVVPSLLKEDIASVPPVVLYRCARCRTTAGLSATDSLQVP